MVVAPTYIHLLSIGRIKNIFKRLNVKALLFESSSIKLEHCIGEESKRFCNIEVEIEFYTNQEFSRTVI